MTSVFHGPLVAVCLCLYSKTPAPTSDYFCLRWLFCGRTSMYFAGAGEWPHDYFMQFKRMAKTKDATPFLKPVDPEAHNCPDYHTVIANPMSLDLVMDKFQNGSYVQAREYAADVRLTFNNAMQVCES